jgi:hypothetical protein
MTSTDYDKIRLLLKYSTGKTEWRTTALLKRSGFTGEIVKRLMQHKLAPPTTSYPKYTEYSTETYSELYQLTNILSGQIPSWDAESNGEGL